MSACLSQLSIVSPRVLIGVHQYHLTAASKKGVSVDDAARRGLKRRATTSGASQPPYKLIPANKAAIILPVLLYSSPVAAASQQNAKRRHIGPSGGAFPTPWSLLTSHGASSPVQRLLRARSLFGEATPMGSRGMFNGPTRNICNEQHTLASNTERVAHWQREQRELLQCLLQQQVANFNHSSATAQTSQVCLHIPFCSQFINAGSNMCITCTDTNGCISLLLWRVCVSVLQMHFIAASVCATPECGIAKTSKSVTRWAVTVNQSPYAGDSAMHQAWLQAGTTSSVSYVTASASRQVGAVASLPCLPAIVIRPSNLSHSTSATVATNLACLKSQVCNQEN